MTMRVGVSVKNRGISRKPLGVQPQLRTHKPFLAMDVFCIKFPYNFLIKWVVSATASFCGSLPLNVIKWPDVLGHGGFRPKTQVNVIRTPLMQNLRSGEHPKYSHGNNN